MTRQATPSAEILDKERQAFEAIAEPALQGLLTAIQEVSTMCEGIRPNEHVTRTAESVAPTLLLEALQTGHGWRDPHVAVTGNDEIIMEWWKNGSKLTLYIAAHEIDCVLRKTRADGRVERFEAALDGPDIFGGFWSKLF